MSNALTPEAPEPSTAVAPVGDPTPGDGEAVAEGSAGAKTEYVEASRFNGLMSAHQKTLSEMEAMRTQLAALEARTHEETPQVAETNDAVLEEVSALRQELQRERLATAKAEALAAYPAAAPLADLIVGNTPEEIQSVAAAIADRLGSIQPVAPETPAAGEEQPAPEGAAAAPEAPAAPVAPVLAGGTSAPDAPDQSALLNEAFESGDWNKYWQAKSSAKDTANLG